LDGLTDAEALELLLSRSSPRGARTNAAALLGRFGCLRRVLTADLAALSAIVGANAAVDLQLIYDAARRLAAADLPGRCVVSSWAALTNYLKLTMAHCEREAFRVLFLDRKNQLIADEILNHGTVDHAPVYPREVMRRALELSASALILVHNHPSGDPTPSAADIEMTRKIVEAGRALAISIHDHVVVGRADIASLKMLGLM
jgi:DNA repair protein RadC